MVTTKPLTLVIDSDLWHQFKSTVTRDLTLNDAVVQLIQNHVNLNKSEKKGVGQMDES